jgi:hypothetical protein
MNEQSKTTATPIDGYLAVSGSFYRPTTRGELLNKLKSGVKCEVVSTNEEISSICLDGWLNFKGQYKTYLSENIGWTVYEPIPKWKNCQNCDCGEFQKRRCDCSCHD